MEQILLAYGLPKEIVTTIKMLHKNLKSVVDSPDGNTNFFSIVTGILQGDTLGPYMFIICLDYIFQMSIDLIKENGYPLKKASSR